MAKKRTESSGAEAADGRKAKPAARAKKEVRANETGAGTPERAPAERATHATIPRVESLQGGGDVVALAQGPEYFARVARKAYELFEQRGREPGHDVEDWIEAERLVREEMLHETQRGRA